MIFSNSKTFFALLLLICLLLAFAACEEDVPVPKPRAFPKVAYPAKEYAPFDAHYCAFTFDCPKYAVVEQDTLFFDKAPKDDCWFNLAVQSLNAKIHCSYSPITKRQDFDELVQDAFVMAQKHNVKASFIEEIPVHRYKDKVHGVIFNIDGPAASSYQFYLTDSTRHFLRGALYFNTQARPDSLEPVLKFMKSDVDRLVGTLKWN